MGIHQVPNVQCSKVMVDWVQNTAPWLLEQLSFLDQCECNFTSGPRRMVRWQQLKKLLNHQGCWCKGNTVVFSGLEGESKAARLKCHVCILLISYLLIPTDELLNCRLESKETDSEAQILMWVLQGRKGITSETPQALTAFRFNPGTLSGL